MEPIIQWDEPTRSMLDRVGRNSRRLLVFNLKFWAVPMIGFLGYLVVSHLMAGMDTFSWAQIAYQFFLFVVVFVFWVVFVVFYSASFLLRKRLYVFTSEGISFRRPTNALIPWRSIVGYAILDPSADSQIAHLQVEYELENQKSHIRVPFFIEKTTPQQILEIMGRYTHLSPEHQAEK